MGICSETWKKRCLESAFVVCGSRSVRSMGPPFQVDSALIFTLTPCFSPFATGIEVSLSTVEEDTRSVRCQAL